MSPVALDRIIAQTLQKDCGRRAQSAARLRIELKQLQTTFDLATARPHVRALWLVAGGAVVLTGLLAWYAPARRYTPSWKNAAFRRLTTQPGQEVSPGLSPDGSSFLYAARASGNWDIYLQIIGDKKAINLTAHSSADDQPAFFPDGSQIAFRFVHTKMCILNPGFGIRQMTRLGFHVALVRDLTHAMYDPRKRPFASHTRGTELVIEHRVTRSGVPQS